MSGIRLNVQYGIKVYISMTQSIKWILWIFSSYTVMFLTWLILMRDIYQHHTQR